MLAVSNTAPVTVTLTMFRIAMKWTDKEEQYIRDHHAHMTDAEIAEVLGRTRSSVRSKRRRLDIDRPDSVVSLLRGANPTDQNGKNNHNWKGGVSENGYERYRKEYKRNNRKKIRAHNKVQYAIETGKLERQPCEVCGEEPADAHHDDYSKPLQVRWLCRKHHMEEHDRE
jgi:DNA-binding CsgD family transcriptional regulator